MFESKDGVVREARAREVLIRAQPGLRVLQAQYGAGDVLDVDARYTTIRFDDGVVRKFLTNVVRLQPSLEPRPAETPRPRRQPRKRKADPES